MITEKEVYEALRECYDPEIPINVVDLGLIYGVTIDESSIRVEMTMTTPHCPMADFLVEDVKSKLRELDSAKSVQVQLVWDPPWSMERINPALSGKAE
jgi:metal-sulfur cluster biosynthetic enzyme